LGGGGRRRPGALAARRADPSTADSSARAGVEVGSPSAGGRLPVADDRPGAGAGRRGVRLAVVPDAESPAAARGGTVPRPDPARPGTDRARTARPGPRDAQTLSARAARLGVALPAPPLPA